MFSKQPQNPKGKLMYSTKKYKHLAIFQKFQRYFGKYTVKLHLKVCFSLPQQN